MSSRIVDAPQSVPATQTATVVLDGSGLGVEDVVRLADRAAHPVLAADAMRRVEHSWNAARQIAATGRVYGRSTGVGANRTAWAGLDNYKNLLSSDFFWNALRNTLA
ncbi:aromatic amino acid lyase, partial [Streptomyces sp. NPDC002586]